MKTIASDETQMPQERDKRLAPACEEALYRLITERTGIVLHDHQLPILRDAVVVACKRFGYPRAEDYRQALTEKASTSPELEFLVARITVGESYFFRDAAQMALLRQSLLPELIARKRAARDHSLRVWSAGCSNGQEIYSIAILLHELLPDIDDWTLNLLATDINTDVLTAAIRGRYREWSFRATPETALRQYFAPVGHEYELNEDIRRRVKFNYLNLSEDAYPSLLTETHTLDLILCRNVLIYIDPITIGRILNRFADCLVPDGLLLLGPSDHVNWPAESLKRIQVDDASYFRRLSGLRETPPGESHTMSAAQTDETVTAHRRPAGIADEAVAEALRILGPGGKQAAPTREKTDLKGIEHVLDLLRCERWHDTLIAIEQAIREHGDTAGLLQIRAKALANLGHLDAALQACEQSLALDPTDKHTYLIQGIVLMEHGQAQQAEAALRKAVYLDYAFAEAHHQLGLLLLRLGRREAGLKSLGNALTIAEQGDPKREIHNASGMNYGRYADILRNEIDIYAGARPAHNRRQRSHAATVRNQGGTEA